MKTATHYYTRDQIFRFIQHYCAERGRAPSYRDIAAAVGASPSTVSYHVQRLENAGQIVRHPHSRRPVAVVEGAPLAIPAAQQLETTPSLTPILDTFVVSLPPRTWMPQRRRRCP